MILLNKKPKKIGKAFQIHIDSYNSCSLIKWNTDIIISISCISVLERQNFSNNNIAHLRLLFSKINRRGKYGITWNV